MTEDKLNGLFDEIRNESAQTSISEVDQWIDAAVATAATVGLLATLKLILIKKPLIMWTTLVTITGTASLGVALVFNQPEVKEKPEKKEVISYSVPAKALKEEKIEEPKDTESPILEEPIRESNSENPDLPEDLGALIPLKTIKPDNPQGVPLYRKPDVTGSFTKVHLAGALYVELSQGKSCSVQIEPESAKDLVEVEIQNGTLYLKNAPDKKSRKEKVVIKVSIQDLEQLHLSGATSLMTMHQFGLGTLSLEMDGASNANLNLKATKLKAEFSGASNVVIEGSCENADLDISGAAQVNMMDLSIKNAKVTNSGAGHAELSISESLKADGSGASNTYYKVASGSKSIRVDANTTGSAVIKDKR
nr:head GIN domain-containing protein [uncultured Fluviicola sp.]